MQEKTADCSTVSFEFLIFSLGAKGAGPYVSAVSFDVSAVKPGA
jgi:hypothetical protein